MFGFFARNIVSVLCIILFNVSGTIATASEEMTAEKFCGKDKYTVHGKAGIGPNGRSAERRNLSELASNIDRYIGANIRIEGHFFLNPSAKTDDIKSFLEGKVGPIAKCVFNENETYATASHGKMVPAIVFAEDFPPIPYGLNKIKKNIFRDTYGMKSRNPYHIQGKIYEWDGTPYIHVTRLFTNTIEWTPKQLKQVETQSSPTGEHEKITLAKGMTAEEFCSDGYYYIVRNGKRLKWPQSIKDIAEKIHLYVGDDIDLYGHFYPWAPVRLRGDFFDGEVGPMRKCNFDRKWPSVSPNGVGLKGKMVGVAAYKEDFSIIDREYEKIKKMVTRNTFDLFSSNVFNIKGTINKHENGVHYIHVKSINLVYDWQPPPRLSRELEKKLIKEGMENWFNETIGEIKTD